MLNLADADRRRTRSCFHARRQAIDPSSNKLFFPYPVLPRAKRSTSERFLHVVPKLLRLKRSS